MKTSIRETPFKVAYGSETVIPAEIHMANHRVMKYKDEENEKQLRLNKRSEIQSPPILKTD